MSLHLGRALRDSQINGAMAARGCQDQQGTGDVPVSHRHVERPEHGDGDEDQGQHCIRVPKTDY